MILLSDEQLLHFLCAQVFRLLSVLGKGVNFYKDEFCQTHGNILSPRPPGLVLVEHDDDLAVAVGVSLDQLLLRGGHGAAHEGNHPATTELVEFHATEEAFNDDQ